MRWTAIVALLSAGLVFALHPEQIGVLLMKVSLLAAAGWGGYLLDRELFPYARPHVRSEDWAPQVRRALIVGAAMLAMALAI
jgi:hypothetical protein